MKQSFLLPRLTSREKPVNRLLEAVMCLPIDKAYRVTIEEQKKRRSDAQHAYLWGCVYPTIIELGGESLGGWSAEDLHEYCLGEWSGWEVIEGFGRKRMRPRRRSSGLSTGEFSEFTSFIQRKMAEHSIVIPDPDPDYAEHRDEEAA